MNTLPPAFEQRIRRQLGNETEAFLQALNTPAPVSIRLNPGKTPIPADPGTTGNGTRPVPWCPEGLYLPERPAFTLDPLLHGGAYYVQEASSMFLAHVLRQLLPAAPVRMLDLCAAPGGKSTLAASLLPPGSLLVANEVIRSRAAILRENIIKWGQDNIVVTNNDPAGFDWSESGSEESFRLDIYSSRQNNTVFVHCFEFRPYEYISCSDWYKIDLDKSGNLTK